MTLTIRQPAEVCTVIVTVDTTADAMPALEAHARAGIDWFGDYAGFVSGALHRSAGGTRLVQYLQWESEASYRACVDDPRWDAEPTSREFMALVAAGRVRVDARVFTVVATSA